MIVEVIKRLSSIEVRIGPRGRPGENATSAWADITGKPSTFPPSSHTHPQSEITGLEAALAGKAASTHSHIIGDVTGLQSALDGKAASSHTHAQSDVTGLTSALALKADLVDGLIPTAQIPAIAITDFLGSVASEAAMLALSGQRGDWCNRSDTSTAWVIIGSNPALLASWAQINYPASPVTSVNGQSGVVVLGKADVGLGNVSNALQLVAANNLSDLASASAARSNLGLGTLATQNGTISDYLTIAGAASAYQPLASPLTAFAGLANGAGVLTNDGTGSLTYTATSAGGNSLADANKIVRFDSGGGLNANIGFFVRSPFGIAANPFMFMGFDGTVASYQDTGKTLSLGFGTATGEHRVVIPPRGTTGSPATLITDLDTGTVTNGMLAGSIALSKLSITGTPDGTKFLRDDGSWQSINLSGYATTGANTFTGAQTINQGNANASALIVSGHSLTGSNAQSLIDLSGTWNTSGTPSAIKLNITDTASNAASLLLQLQTGGTNRATITKTGFATLGSTAIVGGGQVLSLVSTYGTSTLGVGGGGALNVSGGIGANGTISAPVFAVNLLEMQADANYEIGLRRGTNAAKLSVYNTFTGLTNFERFAVDWKTTANTCRVGTEKGSGGGSARALALITDGTARITIDSLGRIIPVLPTSASGLPTGALWNDSGTVKVA